MTVLPILFEDHTSARFRPLSWSQPLFEVRCGMFSLRERLGLLSAEGGALAVRPLLGPLGQDPRWKPLEAGRDGPCLWLNGRLAPDFPLLQALLQAADQGVFALSDDGGLLALAGDGPVAAAVRSSWRQWMDGPGRDEGPDRETEPWQPPIPADWTAAGSADSGLTWRCPRDGGADCPPALPPALGWIWDIVPRTAAALGGDLQAATGRSWRRHPYGLVADAAAGEPVWARTTTLTAADPGALGHLVLRGSGGLHLGPDTDLMPGTVVDTRQGPVILDREVSVGAHVFLEGPLYLGPGCRVKAGAALYGESSYGVGNRLAGEIGESTFGDFANKQHDGFIGHAVLGSWINLGAMTTCSDLKNNYGPVRVDLGWGQVDSGLRFVGLLMGDHAKTAIGTLFNTGTCVGFGANIFGGEMPPKHVPGFSWGGQPGSPAYAVDKAVETARTVMGRRGCRFGDRARGTLRGPGLPLMPRDCRLRRMASPKPSACPSVGAAAASDIFICIPRNTSAIVVNKSVGCVLSGRESPGCRCGHGMPSAR